MGTGSDDRQVLRQHLTERTTAAATRVAACETDLTLATAYRDQLVLAASRAGVSRPVIGTAAGLSVSRIEQILRQQTRGLSAFVAGDRIRIATTVRSARTDRDLKGYVGAFGQELAVRGGRTIVEVVLDDHATNPGINDLDIGPTLALEEQLVPE